ncbi:MAG TPA: PBP1A family penicillin-binding protein [Gemmatimonadaceae bacterium]|nr:PBP1A family penicillin-binding protein [Gemmatimonadaceae bacterium]
MASRSKPGRFFARHPRLARSLLLGAVFLTAAGIGTAYASWALVCRGGACPSIDVLEEYTPRQTSKLYAVDGRFLAEIGLERRTLIKLGDIPKVVRDAFVITEDKRFYEHSGIDWTRVAGAAAHNLRSGGYGQGFSTITMQLARNVFPERISREKNLSRKLKEAKVARAIESRYTKGKILELYLNQIYLGNGAYGVETAAQRYFGKSARDLNVAEAATLAALPKGPERYNPRRYPERAVQRRNTVIELMRRAGAISNADASLAKAYPLQLARKTEAGETAPYFVEWVRQQLDQQFGKQLYEQGLKVYTTLDVDMQSAAERALEQQLRAIEGGKYGKYPRATYEQYVAGRVGSDEAAAGNSPYLQGAFVALDPRTGAVRALVGGRDFDDSKFNRATQALRQPGSTFKPIVYADAIQSGRPPSYIVDDSPLNISQADGSTWSPQNYDGKFEGPMILRRALYMSRNLATIRLGMELGEQSVVDMARRFGISTPIPPYPSIHIGSADVYPLEMIAAYTAFANLGVRSTPNAIVRVENAKGDVLWEPTPVKAQVMSPEESWLMVDIMKDVIQKGTAAGSVGSVFRVPAGGKTGTTNDGADVWFIGYTADLVAGVWMGMDRPAKIKSNAQGGVLAAPAWTAFMTEVYRRKPAPPDWPKPELIIAREIDRTNGLLKNPFCPPEVVYTEYYVPGTEPVRECDLHTPFDLSSDSTGALGAPVPGAATGPGIMRVTPGGAPIPQPAGRNGRPRDTTNIFKLPP